MKRHLLTLSLFLLAGCETMQQQPQKLQAQIEHERITTKMRAADSAFKACNDAVNATGIQKKLYEEILFENDKAANKFKLMTKNELPSKEQIEYLEEIIPALTKCRVYLIEGFSTTPFQNVVIAYFNAQDEIYLKLLKSEITISKANEERVKIMAQQRNDWNNASAEMDARLRAMHESEMAGRRQAAAAILPYLMQQQQNQQFQQQMLYQQQIQNVNSNRPILTTPSTTNCSTYGNQIHCTSR